MEKAVVTQIKDQILHITIHRESKYNALNKEVFDQIDEALDELYHNGEIKSALITGQGAKAFAAGADIAEFSKFNANEALKLSRRGHNVFFRIENCYKPIIAAVNGFALGGGLELAMACHFRIASENASFGQPEVNLGLIPGYGGTQRLVQLIGKGKAMELLMTADSIKADEALRLGLVNHVVTSEALIPKAVELLQKINTKAPLAIGKVIFAVNSYFNDGPVGYTNENKYFSELFDTEDFKEGVDAFLNKRKADFKGK
ncbi:MAG: enoyl-CoA hydratase-related protein [Chitinophagales bacterium]|jgi:enoyl-CoA hydratase|nr:enoyl-CoA hydratase-related protein [Chitinophagales bacterium]